MVIRPFNRGVAVFGDSRTANGFSGSSPNFFLENYGYSYWVNYYSLGEVFINHSYNFGVGGDTTIQMMDRFAAVLASDATIVIILAGTNDFTDANNIQPGVTIQNFKTMIRHLQNAGKVVVMVADTPRGGPDGTDKELTQAQFNKQLAVRNWILTQAPRQGVVVADPWTEMVAPGGKVARKGVTHDGLHPGPIGAEIIGRHIVNAIKDYWDHALVLPTDDTVYSALANKYGNQLVNGLFKGTGASVSATVNPVAGSVLAPSWAVSGSTYTGVATRLYKEPDPDGFGEKQCIHFTGNATTDGALFTLNQSLTIGNLTEGGIYKGFVKVEVEGAGEGLLNAGFDYRLTINAVNSNVRVGDKYIAGQPLPARKMEGVCEMPRYTHVALTTLFQPRVIVYLNPGVELNTIVKVSRCFVGREPV